MGEGGKDEDKMKNVQHCITDTRKQSTLSRGIELECQNGWPPLLSIILAKLVFFKKQDKFHLQ